MELYDYKGRNKRGEVLQGSIESPSPAAVAQWLMETEIFPISINPRQKEGQQVDWRTSLFGERAVSQAELLLFTRLMATMTRANMPLMQAIDGIERTTVSKPLAKVMQSLRDELDRGSPLSSALSRHPKVFDDYYINMVRVGESTGQLHESFQALYKQIDFDRAMRQRVKSALRYPMFVLAAVVVALGILTLFVIPVFSKVYAGMHVELPVLTRILLGTSEFAKEYWLPILMAAALAYFFVRFYLSSPAGRYSWDRYKLGAPIIGRIINKATIARFAGSFAAASRSGVRIVEALQLVSKVVDNAYCEERIQQLCLGVERGETLSRAMRATGLFSPLEIQMVSVGEEAGDVEGMIEQIALMHKEDVEYETSQLSASLEPLLLVMMGALVGIMLLGVFMPLWDMGQATFTHMRR